MSKEYVMQLEATIANLRRDNQMLKERLEAIDNANPSEALECVEDLIFNFSVDEYVDRYDKNLATIKATLLKAQEQEKVLKIIFEKNVDIFFIKSCKTLQIYTVEICKNSPFAYGLTQEEFELLKR